VNGTSLGGDSCLKVKGLKVKSPNCKALGNTGNAWVARSLTFDFQTFDTPEIRAMDDHRNRPYPSGIRVARAFVGQWGPNARLDSVSIHDTFIFVIQSFRCRDTRQLWMAGRNRRFSRLSRQGLKKLAILDAAEVLETLRVPPGNRLEALRGNRAGQHSIRINNQWRICFHWTEDGPQGVEIVDYH